MPPAPSDSDSSERGDALPLRIKEIQNSLNESLVPRSSSPYRVAEAIDKQEYWWPSNGTHSRKHESEEARQARLERMAESIRTVLECVGEDPRREGLLKTPMRYARALMFFTQGYEQNMTDIINEAVFEEDHDEMVIVKNVDIFSMCEHHMVPFVGKISIGYIPNGRVLGLSKLARIAEMFSRRLQVQERITKQVATSLQEILKPQGVAVTMEASHMCMVMRGVQKPGSSTVTSCMLGVFREDPKTREEFLRDDEFVTVVLKCPYVKAGDVEFYVNETEFKVYVRPYFLRLHLPKALVEDGREKASYNVDRGEITVVLPKAIKGEHFPDLDLLTKLMAPRASQNPFPVNEAPALAAGNVKPLIEVVHGAGESGVEAAMESLSVEGLEAGDSEPGTMDLEFNWDLPQELPQVELQTTAKYGFNNAYSGYGTHIGQLAEEILDVRDLDTSTPTSRRENRLLMEELKFDDEYYMADFINEEEPLRLIRYKPEFWSALRRIQKARVAKSATADAQAADDLPVATSVQPSPASHVDDPWLAFTEREQELMRSLPNKEYLLDNERATYLGLVDIVYAYCYNYRTTEGDNTVESPWTICKLSSTLSCFDTFSTLRETLVACIRRALAYPLHRHYALATRCIEDVAVIFKLGKRALLKVLLEVKQLVGGDDRMYVLSRLWIDDYCVWVQKSNAAVVLSLASELNHIKIQKSEIGWSLEELEQVARETPAELESDVADGRPTQME
ncbi:Hsp90 cochaperone shq1 [Gaertneriomyces sp. JEL0708]|nr:Hsp90 cochaperone shq1 [Gaertneriomyces sp. JEL0708]